MASPGPLIHGDPIDPNEQFMDAPYAPIGNGYPGYPIAEPTFGPTYSSSADERPGEAVIAASLALVTASLLLITGFVVIFAASSLVTSDGTVSSQRTTLFILAGFTNVITAALLILGGVLMLGRSTVARGPLALGTLLCMALGIFWVANDQGDSGVLVWLLIFCVPAAAATILATTTRVSAWLRPDPRGARV